MNPNGHSDKPVRHPLPAKPPVQACLKDALPSKPKIQPQPTSEDQTTCADSDVEAYDWDSLLQLQDLPGSGDDGHPTIRDYMAPEPSRFPSFESSNLSLSCTASQLSHDLNTENSLQINALCDATVDPALLDDHHSRSIDQVLSSEDPSRSSDETVSHRSMRQDSPRVMKTKRQRSKTSKVSVVMDNRHLNQTGRKLRANAASKNSFSILRDHFSSLPVEDRLQFLSWLFEGALSQCLPTSSCADGASALDPILGYEEGLTSSPAKSSVNANVVDLEVPTSSRKGLRFLPEEGRLLVKLREEEALTWSEVTEKFSKEFPGRTQGALQVYWSTTLKKCSSTL